jgi:hypothetical protein
MLKSGSHRGFQAQKVAKIKSMEANMKRILCNCTAVLLIFSLTACSSGTISAETGVTEVTTEDYISQLWSALESTDFPVETREEQPTSEGYDPDIGEYVYTGYIITNGVYASTYENEDQSKLLRTQVMIDMNMAQREQISSGAFAISNMINYFDPANAKIIGESLNTSNIATWCI